MALIQNDSDYTRLERSIDRMFNEFFADMNIPRRSGFNSGLVIQPNANGSQSQNLQAQRLFHPNVDVYERPEAYAIYCELPGARREDLQLEVRGDSVLIQGEIKFNQEQHRGDQVRYQERRFGRFERRIPLPESIKRDEIKAKFEQGVLEINIPKNQQPAKKINIA
ncbi:HSP20-like chaperone [Endogone sp. FLAS-F59071]|nr:HSP20-like chaperone [Endogone sp. FLAS-F59071]|eukprot:RUS19354.1 HSP20-like chaperone [Endogone sp. FLAS-F59071]